MSKKQKEPPVVVPAPNARIENNSVIIEAQAGLDQVLVQVLDETKKAVTAPMTRKLIAVGTGSSPNTIRLEEMTWLRDRVSGQEYTVLIVGTDPGGDNLSQCVDLKWTAPGPRITLPPPPEGEPVLLANPNPAPAKPAKDDDALKSPSKPPATKPTDREAVNRLNIIIIDQTNALGQLEQSGALPEWMNMARLNNMSAAAEEVVRQFPDDETVKSLEGRILAKGKLIKEALANASAPASAKQKPEPKPATTPADSPARGQEDEGSIPIVSRVEKLEKRADQTDQSLDAVSSLAAKGIKELTRAIADLKPSSPPASGTPSPQQPIIQHFHYPQSKDNAGIGGDGDDSSKGGKASADKNPPKSADRSWIMLLLGILGTLLLFIGVGGWIVSSLLGGWILGSKGPSAGFTPAMVPPVVMITNTVTPVTPPAVQQAVASTQPVLTPEEIQAYANKHLAMQIQANKVTENIPGLTSHPVDQTTKGGKEINNSGIIGNGNTIINNYHQAPDVHRNGNQAVTPRQTDDVTPTNTTMAVRPDSDWTGPRVVRTLPNWSPTGTFGKVEFLDLYGPGTGFSSE
jgi:hypothetical protein